MTNEIIFAGFGGQGILFSGKVLAYAGLMKGKEVSWLPSYGPEMRGGTANCHIVVSDAAIGSPIIVNPSALVVMNKPSLDKFEDAVVSGGVIVVDSSLVDRKVKRDDVSVLYIPATKIAHDNGTAKLANMIMVGALAKLAGIFTMEEPEIGVKKSVPSSKMELVETNMKAIETGYLSE